jgi:hypothetical protein
VPVLSGGGAAAAPSSLAMAATRPSTKTIAPRITSLIAARPVLSSQNAEAKIHTPIRALIQLSHDWR